MPPKPLSFTGWPDHAATPQAPRLALHLVDEATGGVLVRIPLASAEIGGLLRGMGPQPIASGEPREPRAHADQVAGRIEQQPTELRALVTGWVESLRARRLAPRSVAAYRQVIERAVKDAGWSCGGDVTGAAVLAWLAHQSENNGWSGATYNRNLVVFRSLLQHLVACREVDTNYLDGAARAATDDAPGARAATTEEACRMVRVAWARESTDGRSGSARSLWYACLFLAGCRYEEPGHWCWRDLALDESVPVLIWRPAAHKNRKGLELPLHPVLAGLLRQRLRAVCEASGLGPRELDASPVFGRHPPRTVFRSDRERAGIEPKDRRGRGFSPHSARKWFATTLTQAGVHARVVDVLMRHSTTVPGRYVDIPVPDLAAALATLPSVWPFAGGEQGADCGKLERDLTTGRPNAEDGTARLRSPLTERDASPRDPTSSLAIARGLRRGIQLSTGGAPGTAEQIAAAVGSRGLLNPEMPITGPVSPDRNALADLLDAVARLLRKGAGLCPPRPQKRRPPPQGPTQSSPAA